MKKREKKLTLHRDTLGRLDAIKEGLADVAGGIVTSCTYECGCPGGCTGDQPCLGDNAGVLVG